jgi:predicted HAD superfamily Cof-like phosphohydrolase
MSDLIASTSQWFADANQQPQEPTPNVRQIAFYLGMQCEELAEKLAAIGGGVEVDDLKLLGKQYKEGDFDVNVAEAIEDPANCKELLDGDVDLVWVSIGAARAQGADFAGAYTAVNGANQAKRWPDGEYHNDPKTNKVLKPEGWQAADLRDFLHPTLRGE